MGYKLINIKLKKGSANISSGINLCHTLAARIAQCANFSLTSEQTYSTYYYGLLNNGEYAISNSQVSSGASTGEPYIGLPKLNSGSFYCYGFYMYLIGNAPMENAIIKMIVDSDNNLVYMSKITGNEKSNSTAYGFLLTNGGVKNIEDSAVYAPSASSGATPEQIATIEHAGSFGTYWQGPKNDIGVYKSNLLGYDANNNIIIADHITQIMSSKIYNPYIPDTVPSNKNFMAADSAYEIIMVDDKKFMRLYGNSWIQIDEIVDEDLEVVAP